jgi:hypothetical protein
MIASIEGQAVVDKVLQNLQAKGILQPPSELLPAGGVSPELNWFA